MVTGLMIGAASKKVVDSATLKPRITNPRATGTFSHSQTGMNVPSKEIERRLNRGRRSSRRIVRSVGANRRMTTETRAPRITKGRASTTMLSAGVTKSYSPAGSVKEKASAAVNFNHSRSAVATPNPAKSARKRTTARLLNLANCTLCTFSPYWR